MFSVDPANVFLEHFPTKQAAGQNRYDYSDLRLVYKMTRDPVPPPRREREGGGGQERGRPFYNGVSLIT